MQSDEQIGEITPEVRSIQRDQTVYVTTVKIIGPLEIR